MRRARNQELVLVLLAAIWWEARRAASAAEDARALALTADDFDPLSWEDWRTRIRDKLIDSLLVTGRNAAIRRKRPKLP